MNFATWSVRNPLPSLLLFVFLTIAGVWGFRQLNIQSFPDMDFPMVTVTLTQPGMAPAQLETEVARKVEDAIATLQSLKRQRTTVTDGRVSITVEFELGRPLQEALLDVKDAVDKVRGQLPSDIEEPLVSKVTVGPGGGMLTYALADPGMNEEALSWFVDDKVAHAVMSVPGATAFVRLGGVSREVRVTVHPAQMAALGVTAVDISRALKRVQQDASGGRGQLGGLEQGVRTLGTVERAQDLQALPIALADGRFLRLDQVATVQDSVAERRQVALLDGHAAIGFQISRTKGFDEKKVADGVAAQLDQLKAQHPGLEVRLVRTTVTHTMEQYEGSMSMLLEGSLLAVIVIWWFLRDWRTTLIGALALPLSIIPTFAVMHWLGYTLNTISLLALAVVVGILVDDAVVEVENIARHLRMGKPVRQATIDAVNEIALAVIATTLTLVAVFLPTALMSGVPGMIFKQFGWTVVAAVLVSLLVARIVTPVLAVWLLRDGHEEPPEGRLMRTYMRCVHWCVGHRKTTLLAGIGFFVLSLCLTPLLPFAFVPPVDQGLLRVNMEMPPGTSLQTTLATAERARLLVKDLPGVQTVFTSIGGTQSNGAVSGESVGEPRKGTLTLLLTPKGQRRSQFAIGKEVQSVLTQVPGARLSLVSDQAGEKMQILLASPDVEALQASAHHIERELRGVPFLRGITSTASLERPEITVRPDRARAAERGVSTQAIGETLRVALSGDFDAALSKLNLDSRQVPIRVQVSDDVRRDIQALGKLQVPGRDGLVPLSSVADLSVSSGPAQIDRYNRERQVTISADLGGAPLGQAVAARDALPSIQHLPKGVRFLETGDAEMMKEMFGGFAQALLLGVLLIYAVLFVLFKDAFQPITILSAVPLSVGGAFVALLMGGFGLGLPSLIGLVMLLGIVTKNSILLADFAVMAQRDMGLTLQQAVIDACRKRARPIVMTTVAMVAGLMPLALGMGGGASFRQPMAVAVMGGLITSTALSLLVVPVVYVYVSRVQRAARRFWRMPAPEAV